MTEAEWLAGAGADLWRSPRTVSGLPDMILCNLDDAGESLWGMLSWAKTRLLVDGRKYRLFACACCRARFREDPPEESS